MSRVSHRRSNSSLTMPVGCCTISNLRDLRKIILRQFNFRTSKETPRSFSRINICKSSSEKLKREVISRNFNSGQRVSLSPPDGRKNGCLGMRHRHSIKSSLVKCSGSVVNFWIDPPDFLRKTGTLGRVECGVGIIFVTSVVSNIERDSRRGRVNRVNWVGVTSGVPIYNGWDVGIDSKSIAWCKDKTADVHKFPSIVRSVRDAQSTGSWRQSPWGWTKDILRSEGILWMFCSDLGISEICLHVRSLEEVKSKDSRNRRSWGGWEETHHAVSGCYYGDIPPTPGNRKNDVNNRLRFMLIGVGVSSHWLYDMTTGSDPERFNHSCNACVRNSANRFEPTA